MRDDSPSTPDADSLALLAHELRTPLTALIGFAEAMTSQAFGPLPPPYDEHAAIMLAAANHLLAVVQAMTDIGGAEAGVLGLKRSDLDAAALAGEVISLFRPRAVAAGVTLDMAASPSPAHADGRVVRQILVNLLDNALRHTAAGGRVTLTLRLEGEALSIAVDDSGGGSPTAAGSGLGLRLARALAGAHGGSLHLQPSAMGGMTAAVRLGVSSGS